MLICSRRLFTSFAHGAVPWLPGQKSRPAMSGVICYESIAPQDEDTATRAATDGIMTSRPHEHDGTQVAISDRSRGVSTAEYKTVRKQRFT